MRQLTVAALLLLSSAAFAVDAPEPPGQNPLGASSDFLLYHPDQSYRMDGLKAYQDGRYDFAARDFRVAARYADKPAQAMLASMYWEGKGVPQDRALGYAWMDLAAERGYPWLVASRERYWQGMSEEERKRAIEAGQSIYEEYGDAAAEPRLSVWLRRGRLQTTGSHTGFVGFVIEQKSNGFGLGPAFDANSYYAPQYWKDSEYRAWSNRTWHPHPEGKVDVGSLEVVPPGKDDASPPPAPAAVPPEQH